MVPLLLLAPDEVFAAPDNPVLPPNCCGADPDATPLPCAAPDPKSPLSISAMCVADPFCTGYTNKLDSNASMGRSRRRIHVSTWVNRWLRGVTTTSALSRSTGKTRINPFKGLACAPADDAEEPNPGTPATIPGEDEPPEDSCVALEELLNGSEDRSAPNMAWSASRTTFTLAFSRTNTPKDIPDRKSTSNASTNSSQPPSCALLPCSTRRFLRESTYTMASRGATGAKIFAISAAAIWLRGTITVPAPAKSLNRAEPTTGRDPTVIVLLVTW